MAQQGVKFMCACGKHILAPRHGVKVKCPKCGKVQTAPSYAETVHALPSEDRPAGPSRSDETGPKGHRRLWWEILCKRALLHWFHLRVTAQGAYERQKPEMKILLLLGFPLFSGVGVLLLTAAMGAEGARPCLYALLWIAGLSCAVAPLLYPRMAAQTVDIMRDDIERKQEEMERSRSQYEVRRTANQIEKEQSRQECEAQKEALRAEREHAAAEKERVRQETETARAEIQRSRALVKCPDCGDTVSRNASVCPHCGYPFRREPPQTASAPAPQKIIVQQSGCAGCLVVLLCIVVLLVILGLL